MAAKTSIEWTEVTWNPVTGCDRTSPGCDKCYALRLAARLHAMGQPRYQRNGDLATSGPGFGVTCHDDLLELPQRWRSPRLVFVNSMSDLFHPEVPDEFIGRVRLDGDVVRPRPIDVSWVTDMELTRPYFWLQSGRVDTVAYRNDDGLAMIHRLASDIPGRKVYGTILERF